MSAISKATTRIKTGVKQATTMEGLPKVFIQLGIGFVVGVIADWILEILVWVTSPCDTTTHTPVGWGSVDIGIPFYYVHGTEYTKLSVDDLILLIITIVALVSKKFWIVIGFFLGWYVSSNEALYERTFGTWWSPYSEACARCAA